MTVFMLARGSAIIVLFSVVLFIVIALTFYTRRGSAINQRPQGAEAGKSPGVAQGPSRISAAEDETEGPPDTHGTG